MTEKSLAKKLSEAPFADRPRILDDLFVKNVHSVVKLAVKTPNRKVIASICTRWFEYLEKCPFSNKLERNYMVLLMYMQLKKKAALSYPFTDPNSLKLDVVVLHRNAFGKGEKSGIAIDDDAQRSSSTTTDSIKWSSLGSCSSKDMPCGVCMYVSVEDANTKLIAENAELADELQQLEFQYKQLEIVRQNYEEIINEYNRMLDEEMLSWKQLFARSAVDALEMLTVKLTARNALKVKSQFFGTLFKTISEDEIVSPQVRSLDLELAKLVQDLLYQYVSNQRDAFLKNVVSKRYDDQRRNVVRRYKVLIRDVISTQQTELSLTAMRYLLVLKKLFIETYKESEDEQTAVLKYLYKLNEEIDQI